MKRWQSHHTAAESDRANVALFRSLNMAYNASLLPAGTEATFHDVGRVVALWVSAFEILVHPGGNGQANLDKVYDLIERTPWTIAASGALTHATGGKAKVNRTLASSLYQTLYDCRNAFMHGNPVEPEDLILSPSQRTIFEFAAPLYRLAPTAFLPLAYDRPIPSTGEPEACGVYIAERMEFMEPQKCAEEAIRTAAEPARRVPLTDDR